MNSDPGPEVEGQIFGHFQLFFQWKKFIRKNKLNSDTGPEVGGPNVWSF